MAVCEETKQPFGITVDLIDPRRYKFVWAFKIDKERAHREGYDEHSVTGSVELDPDYPGCPYCGTKQFYICRCGKSYAIMERNPLRVQFVVKAV